MNMHREIERRDAEMTELKDQRDAMASSLEDHKRLLLDIKAWDVDQAAKYAMTNGGAPRFTLPLDIRTRIAKATGEQP